MSPSSIPVRMRDGDAMGDPMLEVVHLRYTLFKTLPNGVSPAGAFGIEVKAVKTKAEEKAITTAAEKQVAAELEEAEAYRKKVVAKLESQAKAGRAAAKAAAAEADGGAAAPQKATLAGTVDDRELAAELGAMGVGREGEEAAAEGA